MKDAIILEEQDIKRILSLHFNVEEKDIIKTKYSFVVTNVKNKDVLKPPLFVDDSKRLNIS